MPLENYILETTLLLIHSSGNACSILTGDHAELLNSSKLLILSTNMKGIKNGSKITRSPHIRGLLLSAPIPVIYLSSSLFRAWYGLPDLSLLINDEKKFANCSFWAFWSPEALVGV